MNEEEAVVEERTTVRRAHPGDLEAIVPLVHSFYEVDGQDFDEERVRRALPPLLESDEAGCVWVVETSEIVGYAVVTWGYSIESGGLDSLLDEIYITDRGRGMGSELMRIVMEDARRRGAARMFLETAAHNRSARIFYSRHGFDIEDSVWMSRKL